MTKAQLKSETATVAPVAPAIQTAQVFTLEDAKTAALAKRETARAEMLDLARKTGARAAVAKVGVWNMAQQFHALVVAKFADADYASTVYGAYSEGYSRVIGNGEVGAMSAGSLAKQISILKVFALEVVAVYTLDRLSNNVTSARAELGGKCKLSFYEGCAHVARQLNKLTKGKTDIAAAIAECSYAWVRDQLDASAEDAKSEEKPAPKELGARIEDLIKAMERIAKELPDDKAFAAIMASAKSWRGERDLLATVKEVTGTKH